MCISIYYNFLNENPVTNCCLRGKTNLGCWAPGEASLDSLHFQPMCPAQYHLFWHKQRLKFSGIYKEVVGSSLQFNTCKMLRIMEQTSNKNSPFPCSGAGKAENHCAMTFPKLKNNVAKGKIVMFLRKPQTPSTSLWNQILLSWNYCALL